MRPVYSNDDGFAETHRSSLRLPGRGNRYEKSPIFVVSGFHNAEECLSRMTICPYLTVGLKNRVHETRVISRRSS